MPIGSRPPRAMRQRVKMICTKTARTHYSVSSQRKVILFPQQGRAARVVRPSYSAFCYTIRGRAREIELIGLLLPNLM